MKDFKEILVVAFAFVGVVVGAGFATGQEVLQFFTSHGINSIWGIVLTGLLVTLGGMFVMKGGYDINCENHSTSIKYFLSKQISLIFDFILTAFLLGLALVMSVGGASTINESFNIPFWLSGLIFITLVSLTLCMQFNKIIRVLSVVTPFLIVIVLIISISYMIKHDFNISDGITSIPENKGLYPWWFDAINYSSLQIAAAFSFLSVMGGQLKKGTHAIFGGLFGGIIIMALLMLINLGLVTEYQHIVKVDLPTLLLAQEIHPAIGIIFSIIMVAVIYNTVVGLNYAFISRFTKPYSRNYYIMIVVIAVITFLMTFISFSKLVATVFPIMGIVGLILFFPVIYKGIKNFNLNS
ncbi:YkvI family membrane protein [Macrococcoides canis]|uniref:YkvI family membrane protein n=1 Tax=Macrococcoides canis TaxID=1855823 RepID=UPI00165E7A53|nr:hypothetical protein [Macrococcus canis]QNR07034.1 hypothetical protein GL258_01760 [Macrococcus canis]